MEYLEKFLDGLDYVPPHLQQKFKVMYELDKKIIEVTKKIQILTNNLFINNLNFSKFDHANEVSKIEKLFLIGRDICNDKVSLAENIYEMIDKQIRSLDTDLQQYKKKISKRIKGNSDSKYSGKVAEDIPSMVALTMALTDNKDEILDMPVDPNEPVYCLCHQVSFGEMVACDNKNCSIEWFHFSCVSLTSKPKGMWFCPNCRGK